MHCVDQGAVDREALIPLLLNVYPLGDIPGCDYNATDVRMGEEILAEGLDVHPRAVGLP